MYHSTTCTRGGRVSHFSPFIMWDLGIEFTLSPLLSLPCLPFPSPSPLLPFCLCLCAVFSPSSSVFLHQIFFSLFYVLCVCDVCDVCDVCVWYVYAHLFLGGKFMDAPKHMYRWRSEDNFRCQFLFDLPYGPFAPLPLHVSWLVRCWVSSTSTSIIKTVE